MFHNCLFLLSCQGFDVRRNYIAHNDVEYRNNLAMFGIYLNFSSNIISHNKGETNLNASVPEKVAINQNYYSNAFHDNLAFGANKTTIFLRSAKSKFENNFLFNWLNYYEMVTFNRTKYGQQQQIIYIGIEVICTYLKECITSTLLERDSPVLLIMFYTFLKKPHSFRFKYDLF